MDLKEEEILGDQIDHHWYYLSKAKMLASHLARTPRRVLDVGAGTGWFSRWLLNEGLAETATCVDVGYEADSDDLVRGRPLHFRRAIDFSNADLILMMDVLEHVDDDVTMLSEYLDKTEPGTHVFITVPAFNFLWSPHDDFLEHRRRYTIKMLRKTVETTGAHVDKIHYYYGSVFPIAVILRFFSRIRKIKGSTLKRHHPVVNSILFAVCSMELYWMRLNRLAGLSVVCLCSR